MTSRARLRRSKTSRRVENSAIAEMIFDDVESMRSEVCNGVRRPLSPGFSEPETLCERCASEQFNAAPLERLINHITLIMPVVGRQRSGNLDLKGT
jgi:hypothetical protein